METMAPDRAVILIVDDWEDDILLIQRAFLKGNIQNPIHAVRSGEEAVAYLKGEGKYSHRDEYPLPGLILLDLKMPGMDGFEVLKWIRREPGLKATRVIVLTASNLMRDVNEAYRLGANSFLVKPTDFDQFTATCKLIKDYWLTRDQQPEISRLRAGKLLIL
jgi:CheY-like chemotaxis protein